MREVLETCLFAGYQRISQGVSKAHFINNHWCTEWYWHVLQISDPLYKRTMWKVILVLHFVQGIYIYIYIYIL